MDIEKPRVENVTVQLSTKASFKGTLFISPVSLELWVLTAESTSSTAADTGHSVSIPPEFMRLVRYHLFNNAMYYKIVKGISFIFFHSHLDLFVCN